MGLPIHLPPLRERQDDILILARHFLNEFCDDNRLAIPAISPAAAEQLLRYEFPGNVRELKAMMHMAAVMCDGSEIRADDLMLSPQKETMAVATDTEGKTLRYYMIQIIKSYLAKYDNNVVLVANKLGIGKSTIYKMIQTNELSLP